MPQPVAFARPLAQYTVRTPSKEKPGGYYQAVLFPTRTTLGMREVVDHYDDRAGIEADLKSDKGGLGVAVIRKRRLAAQMLVVLLMQLAHNLLGLCVSLADRASSAPGQVWHRATGPGGLGDPRDVCLAPVSPGCKCWRTGGRTEHPAGETLATLPLRGGPEKSLSQRWHSCACGVSAQRDLYL